MAKSSAVRKSTGKSYGKTPGKSSGKSSGRKQSGSSRDGSVPAVQLTPDAPQSAQSMLHLQRFAGNRAVSAGQEHTVVQRIPNAAPATVQRIPVTTSGAFGDPNLIKLPEKSLGRYAKLGGSVGMTVKYTAKPPPEASSSGGPSLEVGASASPDSYKHKAELTQELKKVSGGWFDGATFSGKVEGSTAGEYKLGVAGELGGTLAGLPIKGEFGFAFIEQDDKGEIKFLTAEYTTSLTAYQHTFRTSDGYEITATVVPSVKFTLEPNQEALARWFLQRCAAYITAEVAIVGGMVLAGAFSIGAFLLTVNDGDLTSEMLEAAAKARKDYVRAFIAATKPGVEANFENDYEMEGYNRGSQWLRDLQGGAGKDGIPIPESVLKEKLAELSGQATANATAAINAYLHQWLVQQYWKLHWGRKFMGYPIETVFQMLMEEYGFGRPKEDETGEEAVENVAI